MESFPCEYELQGNNQDTCRREKGQVFKLFFTSDYDVF